MEPQIIENAEYHDILKKYIFIYILGALIVSIAGLVLVPVWLIMGKWYSNLYFNNLSCALTEKNLQLKKGHWFRVEKTIPLDKIQDLTLKEGPLLRKLGICTLQVETAGQNSPEGSSDARIIGLRDAKAFRDKVMAQRDIWAGNEAPSVYSKSEGITELLSEIRDSLKNIEGSVTKRD